MDKKVTIWILVLVLLVSAVAQETAPEKTTDYTKEGFDWNTDTQTWTAQDWANVKPEDFSTVPPDVMPRIPPDIIAQETIIKQLKPEQKQKLTADQISFKNSEGTLVILTLVNAKDLGIAALNTVLKNEYKIDAAAGTGFTLNDKGIANNDGVTLNFASIKEGSTVEAIQDGWLVNGIKVTSATKATIEYNANNIFVVNDNTITFAANGKDQSAAVDAKGSVTVTGAAEGKLSVGTSSVDFTSRSGTLSFSGTHLEADDANVGGIGFVFNGKGSIDFDANGKISVATIEPIDEKQSQFIYQSITTSTNKESASIYVTEASFIKAKGNAAFISTTTQKAKGTIVVEDSDSRYTGLQASATMTKIIGKTVDGDPADKYTVDGKDNGPIATIEKKLKIIGLETPVTDKLLTTYITKDSGVIRILLDDKGRRDLEQALKDDPTATVIINREFYLIAGDTALGQNSNGMIRAETGDKSANVFAFGFSKHTIQNRVLLITPAETDQLGKLLTLQTSNLKSLDIETIKKNPELSSYIARNTPINLEKLSFAIQNPNSAESTAYFSGIDSYQKRLQEAVQAEKAVQGIQDKTQRAIAAEKAKELFIQAAINLNTVNGISIADLVEQRTESRAAQKLLVISTLPSQQMVIELQKLKSDPEIGTFAAQALAEHFSAVADASAGKEGFALLNRHLAVRNDPENPELQKELHAEEQTTLNAIIAHNRASLASNEQIIAESEKIDWHILLANPIDEVGKLTTFIGLGSSVSAEQERLTRENTGLNEIQQLHEKGYSLDEITAAAKSNGALETAKLFALEDINSNDPQKKQAAVRAAEFLHQNLEAAISNPDMKVLINPQGTPFAFEGGKSYGDLSFLEGQGGITQFTQKYITQDEDTLQKFTAAESLTEEFLAPNALNAVLGAAGKYILPSVFRAGAVALSKIGITSLGDSIIIQKAIAFGKTEIPLPELIQKAITIGETDVFQAAKKALLGSEAAEATGEAQQVAIREFFDEAEGFYGAERTQFAAAEGIAVPEIQAAEFQHAADLMEGKTIRYQGELFDTVIPTEDSIILAKQTEGKIILSELSTPQEFEQLQLFTAEGKVGFDQKATAAVRNTFNDVEATAQEAKLPTKTANAKEEFVGEGKEQEPDDAARSESRKTTTAQEIEQIRQLEGRLANIEQGGKKIASFKPASDDVIREVATIRRTIDSVLDDATQGRLHYALQTAEQGETVATLALPGDVTKAANKINSATGDDVIREFREGVIEALPQGKQATIAKIQKEVIVFSKDLTDEELATAARHGAERVNALRSRIENGFTIPDAVPRYGTSEILPSANIQDAALIARGKSNIASRLSAQEEFIDPNTLTGKEIKDLGGIYKFNIRNRVVLDKESFLKQHGMSEFNSHYDELMDSFVKSLDAEEQAFLFDIVPEGRNPDFIRITSDVDASKTSLDDLVAKFNRGEISGDDLITAYDAKVKPTISELEDLVTYHDKFNPLNGVKQDIFGRKKWFSLADMNAKEGDYIIAADVNNMGENNIKLLAQELESMPTTSIEEHLLGASTMERNIADQEVIKMVNSIDDLLNQEWQKAGLGAESHASVGVVAGDELNIYIPKELGDYMTKTNAPPAEMIRKIVSDTRQIRISAGQAQLLSKDNIVTAIERANIGLNAAKDPVNVGLEKNAAAIVTDTDKVIGITQGREFGPLSNPKTTALGEVSITP